MAAPLWPILAAAVLRFALPGGTSMSGEAWCFMVVFRQNTSLVQVCLHPKPQNLIGPKGLSRRDLQDLKTGRLSGLSMRALNVIASVLIRGRQREI